jgi:monofunctional biosynthetic peptidoglycan transglycosylase
MRSEDTAQESRHALYTEEDMKLVVAALLGVSASVLVSPTPTLAQESQSMEVIDFRFPDRVRWRIVNDGVMGGRSESSLELTDRGTATFRGNLSLENNGGFASTRALFDELDLRSFAGLQLRVRGDGRSYELRIRTNRNFDGVAYRAEFPTEAGEWTEVFLPFSAFQPSFRGRVPRGATPLDPAAIRQIGLLLGDKKEGPFALEIAWIQAVSADL